MKRGRKESRRTQSGRQACTTNWFFFSTTLCGKKGLLQATKYQQNLFAQYVAHTSEGDPESPGCMEAWIPWKEGNPAHIHNLHKCRPMRGSWTWGKSAAEPQALEQGAHRPVLTIPGLTSLPSMASFCSRKENAKLKSVSPTAPKALL